MAISTIGGTMPTISRLFMSNRRQTLHLPSKLRLKSTELAKQMRHSPHEDRRFGA